MKRLTLLLCILLILSLFGCSAPEADSRPSAEPEVLIETRYYTLTTPENWADNCVIELKEDKNGGDMLVVWEAESHKTEYGGHLFAIRLIPSNEEYDSFPVYELLATLNTPEGSFNVVVLFSDVVQQYSEETAAAYQEVAKDIRNVLNSIRPKEGVEMTMP